MYRIPAPPGLSPGRYALICLLALSASCCYCLLHGWVTGRPRPPLDLALAWAVTTWSGWLSVLPVLTRLMPTLRRDARRFVLGGGALALICLAAMSIEYGLRYMFQPLGIEPTAWIEIVYRQTPIAAALIALLMLLTRATAPCAAERGGAVTALDRAPAPAGLPPESIVAFRGLLRVEAPIARVQHVTAEENYVALHGLGGVPPLVRCTLHDMARRLAPHGFVQVHRSVLVRRDAVVGRLSGDRLRLDDGTVVQVGRRFRSVLERIAPRS
jgi:hypothetical protein